MNHINTRKGRSCRNLTLLATILFLAFSLNSCSEDPEEPGFIFESVSGFVISEQGDKLIATNKGLCSLNVINGKYVAVENELGESSLHDLEYNSATAEQLWLASDRGAYNFSTGILHTKENSGLQNDRVIQIGFNPDHIAFFAGSDGISILDSSAWTQYTGLNDFFLRHEITDVASTSSGYTYVCTYGGGVERFRAETDGVSGATLMDTDWTSLETNNINSVFIDDISQVYATDLGVAFHFSESTKWDWQVYTTRDGLVNDTVLSVTRDKSGNWWIGTVQGICMFDETSWQTFTTEDYDLTSDRIQYLAVDTDGTIWMASNQGLSHYSNLQWTSYPN